MKQNEDDDHGVPDSPIARCQQEAKCSKHRQDKEASAQDATDQAGLDQDIQIAIVAVGDPPTESVVERAASGIGPDRIEA